MRSFPLSRLFRLPLLALLAIGLLSGCAHQSASSEPQLERIDYVSHLDQSERQFFVYLPRGYDESSKTWPVMLFLHGNGERGNGRDELGYVLKHGPLYEAWIQKRDLPFIIIAPQLPMFDMDQKVDYLRNRDPNTIPERLVEGTPPRPAAFATPGPMSASPAPESMAEVPPLLPKGWDLLEADLLAMLDKVESQYTIDPERVYLTGLSYGGFGTWYMASKHPEKFAAIAPVVGWGHPELMAPIAEHQLPLWVFAGGRDSAVEVKYFYPGLNKLEQLGHQEVRFTNHEDMAHDAWTRVYRSEDLYRWLLAQSLTTSQGADQ